MEIFIGLSYFLFPQHHVTYSTNGLRNNSCSKNKISFTGSLQTNFTLGKERTNTNHIYFVCYNHIEKNVECYLNNTFSNYFKKAGISEKEQKGVLNGKDDPFPGFDDIEEDCIQTLGVYLVFLKKRFGN